MCRKQVLKPVGRHVSTVHVGCLPRQVIKTVHPMCCVPSSVDTLSGPLGYHAIFPLMKFVFLCFFLSRAQHNDRASLYNSLANLHKHAVLMCTTVQAGTVFDISGSGT